MTWYKVKKNSLDVSICRLCVVERVKGKIIYTKRKVFDKECFRIILLLSKNYCKYFFWNIQWFHLASFQEILLSVKVQSWLDFSLDFPSYTDQRSGSLINWTCVVCSRNRDKMPYTYLTIPLSSFSIASWRTSAR